VDFKVAAREVLSEVGHPLHYSDITEIALHSGYLKSAGQTPQNTMTARLSVDVRDNPETLFVLTSRPQGGVPTGEGRKPERADMLYFLTITFYNTEERSWSS
jgi:hypothetical protein